MRQLGAGAWGRRRQGRARARFPRPYCVQRQAAFGAWPNQVALLYKLTRGKSTSAKRW